MKKALFSIGLLVFGVGYSVWCLTWNPPVGCVGHGLFLFLWGRLSARIWEVGK